MTDKLPDTPVVHLPWSHWEALTARLDALEAAVLKSPPKQDQSPVSEVVNRALRAAGHSAAAPPPPAAPCADEVEVVARAIAICQGRADGDPEPEEWWENCGEAYREAYRKDAKPALAALSPLRQAERERAWREGAETMRSTFAAVVKRKPVKCEGCGVYWADSPSRLCPGCQAYQEHQQ